MIAQVCADALGVPMDIVRVIHGQTDRIRDGMGAFASRATVMTGSATHMAAIELRGTTARRCGRAAAEAPRRA